MRIEDFGPHVCDPGTEVFRAVAEIMLVARMLSWGSAKDRMNPPTPHYRPPRADGGPLPAPAHSRVKEVRSGRGGC